MSLVIRPADLSKDREVLIAEIRTHLNPLTDQRRFDWLYLANPHGRGRVWIAEDPDAGVVVGTCAALPRKFVAHGEEVGGCVFADFWIHPQYRSLGPAVQLQQSCMDSVRSGEFSLAYDYPRKSMIAVYKRLGVETHDHLVRHTKLLRLDQFLEHRLPSAWVARTLTCWTDPLFQLMDLPWRNTGPYVVEVEEGRCGAEYTELARRVGDAYGICVARSAEYLNWRYRDHFHQRHEFVVARRNGQLAGFTVFVDHGRDGQIVDLFGDSDPLLTRVLVAHVSSILRSRGRSSVSVSLLASDRRAALLRAMSFVARDQAPLIVYEPSRAASSTSGKYCFMYGDEAD